MVLKLDNDNVVECAHSILPPKNQLIGATGGVLTVPNTNEPIAVVCGGEPNTGHSNGHTCCEMCFMLTEDSPSSANAKIALNLHLSAGGSLNTKRMRSVSSAINDGSTLWIAGGEEGIYARKDSELVAIAANPDGFPTNMVGPELPEFARHHCLEKVGPEVAIVVGGKNAIGRVSIYVFYTIDHPWVSTWSFNMSSMTWKIEPELNFHRWKHTCGVVQVGKERIVVAAGGTDFQDNILASVETLLAKEDDNGSISFDQHWELGPSLPMPLSDAASATTYGQQALYIIAGAMLYDGKSQSVLKFHCSNIDDIQCFWTKLDVELKSPSAMGLALVMPQKPMVPMQYPEAAECSEGKLKKRFG